MYCATCSRQISSNPTALLGHSYHPECLYCTRCKTKLWNKPFIKKMDGKLFCENLCSDEPLSLPPIKTNLTNGTTLNGNSFTDMQKSFDLKRRQSNLTQQRPNKPTKFNTPPDTLEQSKFLSNDEILRRREIIKKKQEPFYFNYSDDDKLTVKPVKPRKKAEPFSYNILSENTDLPAKMPTGDANAAPPPPFSKQQQPPPPSYPLNYFENIEHKQKVTNEQYRLANISPFALHHTTNGSGDLNQNDTISYCDTCHQFIEDNHEKYNFNNQTFHKRCFRCAKCRNELYKLKKIASPNNPNEYYCEPCYNK